METHKQPGPSLAWFFKEEAGGCLGLGGGSGSSCLCPLGELLPMVHDHGLHDLLLLERRVPQPADVPVSLVTE